MADRVGKGRRNAAFFFGQIYCIIDENRIK